MNDLGTYLKELRNKLHLSLKDVQERCGVTDSKLSRLERGEGRDFSPLELKNWHNFMALMLFPFISKRAIWMKVIYQNISLSLKMLIF